MAHVHKRKGLSQRTEERFREITGQTGNVLNDKEYERWCRLRGFDPEVLKASMKGLAEETGNEAAMLLATFIGSVDLGIKLTEEVCEVELPFYLKGGGDDSEAAA